MGVQTREWRSVRAERHCALSKSIKKSPLCNQAKAGSVVMVLTGQRGTVERSHQTSETKYVHIAQDVDEMSAICLGGRASRRGSSVRHGSGRRMTVGLHKFARGQYVQAAQELMSMRLDAATGSKKPPLMNDLFLRYIRACPII